MIFSSTIGVLVQAVAALLIFVIGYLALLLCAIAGLVIANLIYRGARLSWFHVMARNASADAAQAKVAETADAHFPQDDMLLAPRHEGSHRVVLVRRSSL